MVVIFYNSSEYNDLCIPESFNNNISHKLFDYTISIVNSQMYTKNPIMNIQYRRKDNTTIEYYKKAI